MESLAPAPVAALRIGIVADDLTGAADSVAPFARRGMASRVLLLGRSCRLLAALDAEAVAIDARVRDVPVEGQDSIHRRILVALGYLRQRGATTVFLKIDSTLRGPLRAVARAAREAMPERMQVVCPALPAQGRVVSGGMLRFTTDSRTREVSVASAFGDDGAPTLSLADVRAGGEAVRAWLVRRAGEGCPGVFCDAETEDDLRILAGAIHLERERIMPVGSAGLARGLASWMGAGSRFDDAWRADLRHPGALAAWGDARTPLEDVCRADRGHSAALARCIGPNATGAPSPSLPRPILVVVGSRQEASRRQVALALQFLAVEPVVLDGRCDAVALLSSRLERPPCVAILCSPGTLQASGAHVAAEMGRVVRGVLARCRASLVVTGGETAWHVCRHLGAAGMAIDGEWEPGVVVGTIEGREGAVRIATKAGGFGNDATLARCLGLCAAPGE